MAVSNAITTLTYALAPQGPNPAPVLVDDNNVLYNGRTTNVIPLPINIPVTAGPPSDPPLYLNTSFAQLGWDSTNNALYVYYSGSWHHVPAIS